jgi:signal transduction histidine kinase
MPLIRQRRQIIYTACGLIGSGIIFLICAVFLWLFRPIGKITEYARAIERDERPAKPNIGIGREVNTLAHALDSMRNSLENRKYVERYVQTLTHEMKSRLAAIRGAAELLDEEMPVDIRKRFIGNILAESARSERGSENINQSHFTMDLTVPPFFLHFDEALEDQQTHRSHQHHQANHQPCELRISRSLFGAHPRHHTEEAQQRGNQFSNQQRNI